MAKWDLSKLEDCASVGAYIDEDSSTPTQPTPQMLVMSIRRKADIMRMGRGAWPRAPHNEAARRGDHGALRDAGEAAVTESLTPLERWKELAIIENARMKRRLIGRDDMHA